MKDLNTNSHRLSIEWSRIQPQPGVWSEPALQRYREFILQLRERGITPLVTLHHFTILQFCSQRLPQSSFQPGFIA